MSDPAEAPRFAAPDPLTYGCGVLKVLPVIRVSGFEEALAVANGTRYGLAAALFTTKMKYAHAFMRTIQAGMIHINHGTASQAHVPFGDVKDSGLGAYSIGHTAKDFFTNVKAVYVKWE